VLANGGALQMFFTRYSLLPRRIPTGILVLSLFVLNRAGKAEVASAASTSGVIVIGFVGGFVRHNNAVHREVQLASHLRSEYPAGVQVRMFENRQGRQAHQAILQLLDSDHGGTLSDDEKRTARIVLYGHSWGASAVVTLARNLEKDGIPVLLTIQVDSVAKWGEEDGLIPTNVVQAVNFYQLNGFLHGRRQILAEDRLHTQILGNFRLDYKTKRVDCEGYPWYAQIFMKPHIEIESDPAVWNQVESLIRSKLPPVVQ
jgi:hypothetical protein